MTSLLLYGSYGYVGQQVAQEAVSRDLPVRLAGRITTVSPIRLRNSTGPGVGSLLTISGP